jgi:hypothetical protein
VRYAIDGAARYDISSTLFIDSDFTCRGYRNIRVKAIRVKATNRTRFQTNMIVERTPWPLKRQGCKFMMMEIIPVSMDMMNLANC